MSAAGERADLGPGDLHPVGVSVAEVQIGKTGSAPESTLAGKSSAGREQQHVNFRGKISIATKLLPLLRRRWRLRGNGWMAHAERSLRGGPRSRQLFKDSAAVSPIITHKLRNNISTLEGSGGNIAVLTGPDGKVLIDSGIDVSRPQITKALADLGADPITHLVNALAL